MTDRSRCYLCGAPARCVIQLAGEDEDLRTEAACDEHARGHKQLPLEENAPPTGDR